MRAWLKVLPLALVLFVAACHQPDEAADNLKAARGFLAANAKQPGVVVLPSGIEYRVVKSGPASGPQPGPSDEVKVNYEGKLLDGNVFDSSFQRGEPADLPMNGLIPAWEEALPLMHPGDEWVLYVPPQLGYGAQGTVGIPPNSLLIFRIQLLNVLPHPAGLG